MLMVISLMTALAFLGFFFFAFVTADRNSAAWFSSQNQESQVVDGSDGFFDFALEQIILGPKQELTNSVLYAGKHSLVPNMIGNLDIFDEVGEMDSNFNGVLDPWEDLNGNGIWDVSEPDLNYNGILEPNEDVNGNGMRDPVYHNGDSQQVTDLHPYNGTGVKIVYDDVVPEDVIGFDYGNGTPDTLTLNFSAGANSWTGRLPNTAKARYSPDVDYTYPDLNNTYLAHFTWVPRAERDETGAWVDINGNGVEDIAYSPVWIPSFHRPQYLPDWRQGTVTNPWQHAGYLSTVLRPHAAQQLTSWSGSGVAAAGGLRFQGTDANFFAAPSEGMWKTLTTQQLSDYSYDIDADGDNIKEAIYLDLDFPATPFDDGADGSHYIPLFGITILDAEGLINLNATGNLNHIKEDIVENVNAPTTVPRDIMRAVVTGTPLTPRFFSASNQGYSTFEINPARALFADPARVDPAQLPAFLDPYEGMFGANMATTATKFQLANYDLFRMIAGAPKFVNESTFDISRTASPGRYGEVAGLYYDLLGDSSNPYALVPFPTGTLSDAQKQLLFPMLFSQAGSTVSSIGLVDDDHDSATGGGQGGYTPSSLLGLTLPPSVHPTDVLGIGNVLDPTLIGSVNYGARRLLYEDYVSRIPLLTDNPSVWPFYQGVWQKTTENPDYTNILTWSDIDISLGGSALIGVQANLLSNEDDELTLEPDFVNQSSDSIFSVAEMEGLHFADGDYFRSELGVTSRLRELMPFNFSDHSDAAAIRRQFTTIGWDRREFRFAPLHQIDTASGFNRRWEFNLDLSNPLYASRPTTTNTTYRDHYGSFPPIFGLTDAQRTAATASVASNPDALPYEDEDPFRLPVRRWLSMEYNRASIDSFRPQRKLLMGKILEVDPETNAVAFRPLTPHPTLNSTGPYVLSPMSHGNSLEQDTRNAPHNRAPDPTEAENIRLANQEWWARYDRQRLARDIYVLLYTFAGPDSLNTAAFGYDTDVDFIDANNNNIDDRVERIAQFAVNLVDAMDEDNHITRFAYDPNLSDGWSTNAADLKIVYGVEEQEIAFSEGIWLRTPASTDCPLTLQDEEDEHQYLALELRNLTPHPLSVGNGSYRLVRLSHLEPSGLISDQPKVTFTNTAPVIPPGENYLVATHDGTVLDSSGRARESVFRGKLNPADTAFSAIIPAFPDSTPVEVSNVPNTDSIPIDVDLCYYHQIANNYFNESGSSPGYFLRKLDNTIADAVAEATMIVSLQRRLVTNAGNSLTEANNPWVEIDRISIPLSNAPISNATTALYDETAAATDNVRNPIRRFVSTARVDRFGDFSNFDDASSGAEIRNSLYRHSLGHSDPSQAPNQPATAYTLTSDREHGHNFLTPSPGDDVAFATWQPHFNRVPTSVIEIFSTPILGPLLVSTSTELGPGYTPFTPKALAPSPAAIPFPLAPTPDDLPKMADYFTAGNWFLNPQGDLAPGPNKPVVESNRWYRVLEFFEIEPQIHQSISNLLGISRTPGKLNLNTTRALVGPGAPPLTPNPQAGYLAGLAAVIDDDFHLNHLTDTNQNFTLADKQEAARDWGNQFRVARDGIDPVWASLPTTPVAVPMPGALGSRPFRSLGYVDSTGYPSGSTIPADNSLQSTLLRDLPFNNAAGLPLAENGQPNALQRRQIFEARTEADVGADFVDYHTRNRLLAKVHNNTTTISNVFYIFIAVEFFEATEQGTAGSGQWAIGRKLTGDLTLPTETQDLMKMRRGYFVVDRSLLEKAYDPTTGRVDFRKLVLHRRKLEPYN